MNNDDPRLLFAFCRAIEESTANGFGMLDRQSLLAIHRALMTLKGADRRGAQRSQNRYYKNELAEAARLSDLGQIKVD